MNALLLAFSARGMETARRIRGVLEADGWRCELRAPERLAGGDAAAYPGSLPEFVGTVFDREALIFVGAAGIAVRAVAPHVTSKRSDPAVLCVDEAARYVIPLLSGHIGGANRLARRLAEALGADAVITTATDVNGRFSVDAWAAERGLHIGSMALAKRVSAEILTHEIPFWSDRCDPDVALPEGLRWDDSGPLGICVSVRCAQPFAQTLALTPKALRIGIGCRRGTTAGAIDALVERVLSEHRLRPEAVAGAASIDVKADEPGLIEFCRSRGWPLEFFTAAQLREVPGALARSEFVQRTVGVDNVCERAALAAGGRLIVSKTAMDGVTVAVAEMEWGIDFGEDSRGGHRPGRL